MNQANILLVDDEEHILNAIQLNLELEGYIVTTAITGVDALKKIKNTFFELIILDVMLPEMNGFDVCEEIRKTNTLTPILFLSAKGTSAEKIQGLKLGADDYLTKPFNLEELLLRINILLKRNATVIKNTDKYTFDTNEINFSTYEIKGINGQQTEITKREISLLKLLIEHKGEVISRETILDKVWGVEVYPSSRTIDNYILAFRKYFEINPREPKYFHSIRGVGYKFTN
jgi:two-component system alkaline phosphatase synthesis response regulator PhoP